MLPVTSDTLKRWFFEAPLDRKLLFLVFLHDWAWLSLPDMPVCPSSGKAYQVTKLTGTHQITTRGVWGDSVSQTQEGTLLLLKSTDYLSELY